MSEKNQEKIGSNITADEAVGLTRQALLKHLEWAMTRINEVFDEVVDFYEEYKRESSQWKN